MKRDIFNLFGFILLLTIFVSCNQSSERPTVMEAATGNPGEILVVMDDASWKNETGQVLKDVFHQDLYTVPEQENIFDLYQIEQSEFSKINKRNRNIIIPELNQGAEFGEVIIKQNVYSKPQTIVYIKAPDVPSFVETVKLNSDKLAAIFLKADRDRILDYIYDYHVEAYRERLEKDHHVSLAVPKYYEFDVNRKDFAWLAHEPRESSQGFLVYRFGKAEKDSASLRYFVKKRNEVLKKNVPGERKGSYMTTETKYHYPILSGKIINNTETWIMDGLWKMENDFMGGPFSAFIQYDESRDEFVCIEAFIYDPRGGHRDKIRKMKAVLHTMKIPD